jgi:resuscitation-promoting factor RpfA
VDNEELVELGDLDELVRQVDRLVAAQDWDGLVDLRDRCRKALERGKQLWPAASLAEYHLALDAPGRWAASVLDPGAGRFALGPLSEVAASTHSWDELAPHAPSTPQAALAAHERVVRGEDLTGDGRVDRQVLELPLVLQHWEPRYPVAEYKASEADFPEPPSVNAWRDYEADPAPAVEEPEARRALVELATAWVTESNGRAEAVTVDGDACGAVAALGARHGRIAEIDPAHALSAMAWTAASGGAHGRRRGMASGRFSAWWAVAALAGLLDEWPVPPDDVGAAVQRYRWYRWDVGEPETGWSLRLAIEDPQRGRAWAVSALDATL